MRSEWESRSSTSSQSAASSAQRQSGSWWRRPPALLGGAVLVVLVVAGAIAVIAGGGGGRAKSEEATKVAAPAPAPKDPATVAAEAAVLKAAQMYYSDQGVTATDCEKTGFTTGADIYSCTLTTADLVTEPAQWQVYRDSSGNPIAATPGP